MSKPKPLPYVASAHIDEAITENAQALADVQYIAGSQFTRDELYRRLVLITNHLHRSTAALQRIRIEHQDKPA